MGTILHFDGLVHRFVRLRSGRSPHIQELP
ncbi:MAG: hypothetical protein ACI867_001793 [Glaciecola sp.]